MGCTRSRLALWVGLVVLVLTLSACGARFRATGAVTDVEGGLNAVTSFDIRTTDGDDLTFVPSDDGDYAFPLSHLRSHMLGGDPVVVEWIRACEGSPPRFMPVG